MLAKRQVSTSSRTPSVVQWFADVFLSKTYVGSRQNTKRIQRELLNRQIARKGRIGICGPSGYKIFLSSLLCRQGVDDKHRTVHSNPRVEGTIYKKHWLSSIPISRPRSIKIPCKLLATWSAAHQLAARLIKSIKVELLRAQQIILQESASWCKPVTIL